MQTRARPIEADSRQEPGKASIVVPASTPGMFPAVRLRRNRKADWSRRLVAENVLTTADLVWPLFLIDGPTRRVPVAHMPGIDRVNIEEVVAEAERAAALGILAIAPFPYVEKSLRDPTGSEALRATNLMCRAVRAIKSAVPHIGLITDVALDPYSSDGHDGVVCYFFDSTKLQQAKLDLRESALRYRCHR